MYEYEVKFVFNNSMIIKVAANDSHGALDQAAAVLLETTGQDWLNAVEVFVKLIDGLPCDECGVLIAADVHAEELGMCVNCSDRYFTHDEEE